ncbi:MAG: AAA-like domain-containing protein, partial [Chloroflexota bacterium]
MRNFWYPGPIDPDSPLFFGRQQELGTLQELCQGELQSYLIIFGGRQTGKTSLLYQVPALLDQSSHLVCHIDFQGLPNANPSQVYQHIASELTLVADWDEPKSPLQTPAMLTRWLLQKVNQMSQAKLVLLFEELGVLPPNTAKALANLLRSWFNGRFNPGRQAFSQVMIALAGGVELYDLAAVKVSPLRNICKPLYLPDLSQTDAVNLVATGLEQARFSNEQGVQCGQAVYQLLAGHPYLTQRLGSEIAKLTPGNWSQITNLPYLADQILLNDALLQHFYHALDNLDLWAALPVLLEGSTKHSRHDRDMALLELLGLAINRDGYWGVRNNFFKATLQQWQNKSHTTSLTPSLTNIQPNSTSIVHQQSIPETRQRALWRVLNAVKSVSAKTVLYAAALGTIGIMYGANLPPELVALAGAIGGDALTNILERIASGDKISDEEITQEVQTIIIESDIADR